MRKKLILIFVIAFLIRLIGLNQSLWLDEATTARVVQQYNFLEILTKFSPHDFHPPLFYWLMKLWTNIFSYSEISLRMPSIIFSLMTGYVIYKIAKLLNGYIVGIWAAIFFLFNPLIVYYSQEARQYIMTTFLLTSSLYFLIKMLQTQSSKLKVQNQNLNLKTSLFFFNIFLVLSFWTFYGSIFFIVAVWVYLLLTKKYKYLILNTLYFILAFLVVSPLLYQQWLNSKIALTNVANWSLVLGKANIKNLLLIPIKFSVGRISFEPKTLYYLVAGIWTGFLISQILNRRSKNHILYLKSINLFYYLFTIPLLLGFIFSFWTPLLQYFRFLYLIPVMSILLGFSLLSQASHDRVGHRWIVATGFLVASFAYLLLPQFHREDWKSLVKNLPVNKPVYMIKSSSDPLVYYLTYGKRPEQIGKTTIDLRELIPLRPLDFAGQEQIIVIPYAAEIYGYNYEEILEKKGYQPERKVSFRGLAFEQWIKK